MKKFGLTLTLLVLFLISVTGQICSGIKTYNEDRIQENLPAIESYSEYLKSGHFISSLCENMESEFLQMSLLVLLTAFLYQKGSSESNKLPEEKTADDLRKEAIEEEYIKERKKSSPVLWTLYEYSLTSALALLFVMFFFLHAYGSRILINEENQRYGRPQISYSEVFSEDEFWFESFQNWQSEFFSVAALGILSIYLRQKGSCQSKKMNDPVWKTGSE
jgi:ABC-type multidrug transport system permease subunit